MVLVREDPATRESNAPCSGVLDSNGPQVLGASSTELFAATLSVHSPGGTSSSGAVVAVSPSSTGAEAGHDTLGAPSDSQANVTAEALSFVRRSRRRGGRARKKPLWRKQDSAAVAADASGTTATESLTGLAAPPKTSDSAETVWRPPPLSKRERSENVFFSALNEIRNAENDAFLFLDVSHCGVSNRKAKTLGMAIREAARKRRLGGIALDMGRNPLNASALEAFVEALLGADGSPLPTQELDGLFTVLDFSECDLYDNLEKGDGDESRHLVARPLLRLLRSPACSVLAHCVLDGSRGLSEESAVFLLTALAEKPMATDARAGADTLTRVPGDTSALGTSTAAGAAPRRHGSTAAAPSTPRHILQIHNIYPESTIRALWETARRLENRVGTDDAARHEERSSAAAGRTCLKMSLEESRLVLTLGDGTWAIYTDVPHLDAAVEEAGDNAILGDAEQRCRLTADPGRRHQSSPRAATGDSSAASSPQRPALSNRTQSTPAADTEKQSTSTLDALVLDAAASGDGNETTTDAAMLACTPRGNEDTPDDADGYDFYQLFEALEQIQDTDRDGAARSEVNDYLDSLLHGLDRLLGLDANHFSGLALETPFSPVASGAAVADRSMSWSPSRPPDDGNDDDVGKSMRTTDARGPNLVSGSSMENLPASLEPSSLCALPEQSYDPEVSSQGLPLLLRVLVANLTVLERGIWALPEPAPRENQAGLWIERPVSLARYRYLCVLQRLVQARRAAIDSALASTSALSLVMMMFLDHPWSNCVHAVLLSIVEQVSDAARWSPNEHTNAADTTPGRQLCSQLWFGEAIAGQSEASQQVSSSGSHAASVSTELARCSVLEAIYRGVCADFEWYQRQLLQQRKPSEAVSEPGQLWERRKQGTHLASLPYLARCLECAETLAQQDPGFAKRLEADANYQQLLAFQDGRAVTYLRRVAAGRQQELCGPRPERNRSVDGSERFGSSVFIDWSSLLNVLRRGHYVS